MLGFRGWAFPLRVIGVNSIAAYCIAHLFEPFIVDSFKTHLGRDVFSFAGPGLEPFFTGVAVLLVYWLILFWMYRRKIFLRSDRKTGKFRNAVARIPLRTALTRNPAATSYGGDYGGNSSEQRQYDGRRLGD